MQASAVFLRRIIPRWYLTEQKTDDCDAVCRQKTTKYYEIALNKKITLHWSVCGGTAYLCTFMYTDALAISSQSVCHKNNTFAGVIVMLASE